MGFMDFFKGNDEQPEQVEDVRPEFVAQVEDPTTGEMTTLIADTEEELDEKIAQLDDDGTNDPEVLDVV